MANFLIAALSGATRPRVEEWLLLNQATAQEYRFDPFKDGFLLIMSRELKRCLRDRRYWRDGRFLRGTVVSDSGLHIGYGLAGWPIAAAGRRGVTGGEFVAATWSSGKASLWTDSFGTVPLLYTTANDVVAASDSLLLLTDLRQHLGLPVSANTESVIARSRTLAIASQQISTETLVNEVNLCPVGRYLEIGLHDGAPQIHETGSKAYELFGKVNASYPEVVRRASSVIVGQIRAVASIDGAVPMLSLTGGRDSRVVLAAALRAGAAHRLFIESHNRTRANEADYAAALGLARSLGLAINNPQDFDFGLPIEYGATVPAIWSSAHLGVYDRLIPTKPKNGKPRSIPMNGLGAGLAKGAYHWRSVDATLAYNRDQRSDPSPFRNQRADAFAAQFRKGLESLGVPSEHPWASEWHYLGYRNGLHSGAHLAINMTGLRPLTQSTLARYCLHPDNTLFEAKGSESREPTIISDILAVIHVEIAALPYDTPERAITPEHASARLHTLGGPLGEHEIPDVNLRGSPADTVGGPMPAAIRVGERWDFDFEHDRTSILEAASGWIADIPNPTVRRIYDRLLTLSGNQLKKKRPADAGPATAKILTARLLV